MTLELKNANSYRSYPFREIATSNIAKTTRNLLNSIVDCQIDIFTDRESTDLEATPLVAIHSATTKRSQTGGQGGFEIELTFSYGFGARDINDNPRLDSKPVSRAQTITSKLSFSADPSEVDKDDKYVYLWISDPTAGFNSGAPGLGEEGTEAFFTGYVALDIEWLSENITITESKVYLDGDTYESDTLFLEESNVTYTSGQLVRRGFIANKDKIPAPGEERPLGRLYRRVNDATDQPHVFNGDVKFEPGFNCEIEVNSDTDTVTFVPTQGGGRGEPCNDSDPDAGEEGCADFIFSINGVRSETGSVTFQTVAPLQIFQGDPDFQSGEDYLEGVGWPFTPNFESQFWTHSLVFRVGDWGPNNDTPCVEPDCP
tara:strand:- start:1218 stop:2333 length:1116 start_codon:yes stop_codon:yes gene_type:complete